MAEKIADPGLISAVGNKLGLALWGAGKLDQAAAVYRNGLEIGRQHDSKLAQARTSNNLAIINWEQGDFIAAERLMSEALEIFRDLGDRRKEAYSSGNLAGLHKIFGRFQTALKLLLSADLVFQRLADRHAHYYVIGNIGDLKLVSGDLKSAHNDYMSAYKFASEVGDRELQTECEVRFGDVDFYSGRIVSGKERYENAAFRAQEINSGEFYLRSLIGLTRLLIGQKDYLAARRSLDKIIQTASENNSILVQREAEFLTGECYRLEGDTDHALGCYHEVLYYALSQNVFELILKSSLRLWELDPEAVQSSSQILQKLIMNFIDQNGLENWQKLHSSAYFSYFSKTIQTVSESFNWMTSHTV
jgi:tetratricopeptide (TPR) repeat protein